MSHPESLAGKLLVANPLMGDPNFARTVVLILEDDETDGTMGLVLSRPTEEPVGGHLPMWADTVAEPDVIFIGGPVMTDVAIGLGAGPAVPPEEWKAVVGDVGLVDVAYSPDHWGGLSTARIFAGYSGWIPGQLAAELAIESWVVCDAAPGDATDPNPDTLWQRVLSRQSGTTAWLATFPWDVSTN